MCLLWRTYTGSGRTGKKISTGRILNQAVDKRAEAESVVGHDAASYGVWPAYTMLWRPTEALWSLWLVFQV